MSSSPLARMYPEADVFTRVVVPKILTEELRKHTIKTSFVAKLPQTPQMYISYLPLTPIPLGQVDLRGYDLIISSESGPATGIIPLGRAVYVRYCHSPMWYIWNMYRDDRAGAGQLARLSMSLLTYNLPYWKESSAERVDRLVANSSTVDSRTRRYYCRSASVVHPSVHVSATASVAPQEVGDYNLMAGELVRYKWPDIAVSAFDLMGGASW